MDKKTTCKRLGTFVASVLCICIGLLLGKLDASAAGRYTIQVNKGTNVVTIYDSNNKPYKALICSTGYATPTGTFPLKERYRWHELDGPCWGQYCSRITNTGILFHSVFYNAYNDPSMLSVRAYNRLGTTASHGCVRLTVAGAKWIYDNCSTGTTVKIINGSSKNDPLGKPTAQKLDTNTKYRWDPTDPSPNNPYRKYSPTITVSSKKNLTISHGAKVNYLKGITAKDYNGADYSSKIKYSGEVDTTKPGKYSIEYSVKSSKGITTYKTVTYQVVNDGAPTITGATEKVVAMGSTVNLVKDVSAKTAIGNPISKKNFTIEVKDPNGKKVQVLSGNKILVDKAGDYTVTYTIAGPNKVPGSVTRTITSEDRRVVIDVNDTIVEYGSDFDPMSIVTLTNYEGKKLKPSTYLNVSGKVDTNTLGEYIITYTANDKVKPLRRTMQQVKVIVLNQLDPVFSGLDLDTVTIPVNYNGNTVFNCMQNVSAKTATGVDITNTIQVTIQNGINGPVYTVADGNYNLDITKPGVYIVTYTVTVPVTNGKTCTKTLTIHVTE